MYYLPYVRKFLERYICKEIGNYDIVKYLFVNRKTSNGDKYITIFISKKEINNSLFYILTIQGTDKSSKIFQEKVIFFRLDGNKTFRYLYVCSNNGEIISYDKSKYIDLLKYGKGTRRKLYDYLYDNIEIFLRFDDLRAKIKLEGLINLLLKENWRFIEL